MFVDANVLIYAFNSRDEKGERSRNFLRRVADGEPHSAISILTLDEVVFLLSERRGRAFALKAWQELANHPHLEILSIDARAAAIFPALYEQGLDPRDALHMATMKIHGHDTICSYDKHFDKITGIKRQEPK